VQFIGFEAEDGFILFLIRIVHPKIHLFALMLFQTCMTFFLFQKYSCKFGIFLHVLLNTLLVNVVLDLTYIHCVGKTVTALFQNKNVIQVVNGEAFRRCHWKKFD